MDNSENLKYVINRYDQYYSNINNKGSVYLALNTFILSGAISGYYVLEKANEITTWIQILFITGILVNFVSLFMTLMAIHPFLNNGNGLTQKSILFFGDVSNQSLTNYTKSMKKIKPKKWTQDLINQAYMLAQGLNTKFYRLKLATVFLLLQGAIIIIFGLTITFNQ